MDGGRFFVALAIVIAGMVLWYWRGIVTRDHELCLDASQAFMGRVSIAALNSPEQVEEFIGAYISWYNYCRGSRVEVRFRGAGE